MITEGFISEHLEVKFGVYNADFRTPRTTVYMSVAAFRSISAAVAASFTNGQAVAVQWKQATSSAGAGAKNLSTEQMKTIAGGSNELVFDAPLAELDSNNGFAYVAATVEFNAASPTGSAIPGAVMLLGAGRRYG